MWIPVLLLVAAVCFWFYHKRHPHNFPPGPRRPLPLFGDAYVLGKDMTEGYRKLTEQYGDIVGFYLGPSRSVLLGNQQLIEGTLGLDDYADRPLFDSLTAIRGRPSKDTGTPGVGFMNGGSWMEQRRFALKTLRDLGFGTTVMEDLVAEEVEDLCAMLEKENSGYVQIKGLFNKPVLKALWRVLTSEDLDSIDSVLMPLWKRMDDAMELVNSLTGFLSLQFPLFSKLLEMCGIDTFSNVMGDFLKICEGVMKRHEDTFEEDSPRDFTDVYLKMRYDNASNANSSFYGRDGFLHQRSMLIDFMQAGTDTSSYTLSWAVLFMLLHPDVKKKVQDELDRSVGRSRPPRWEDRSSTPYTEAVLHEVQRHADLVPNGIPRATIRDVKLGGYDIPKGTQIIPFLAMIHFNPEYFPEPQKFDPNRYISADGKFVPSSHIFAFGLGKRRCLGENLARMELYRFFAGIMHRFDIQQRPGDVLTPKKMPGAMSMPQPFEAKFIHR